VRPFFVSHHRDDQENFMLAPYAAPAAAAAQAAPRIPAKLRHGKFPVSNTGRVYRLLRGEESDSYPTVAILNDRWRVIVCKNSIQWVLQKRRSSPNGWRGHWFCRTSEALLRGVRKYAGDIGGDALVILLRLPERFPGDAQENLRRQSKHHSDNSPDTGMGAAAAFAPALIRRQNRKPKP
jgi:hypothetical protein